MNSIEPVHYWYEGERVILRGVVVRVSPLTTHVLVKLDGKAHTISIHHEHLCEPGEMDYSVPGFDQEFDLGH